LKKAKEARMLEERKARELAAQNAALAEQNTLVVSSVGVDCAAWSRGSETPASLAAASALSLSSWLAREKKRRGLHNGKTSEEITRLRRTERRELSQEAQKRQLL
jgi:hypothetical protein